MQSIAEEMLEEFKQKFAPQIQQLAMQKLEQELRQEVRQEEAVTLALRMLSNRLGSIDASTEKSIRELSVTQLEDLVVAAADFRTNKDLLAWLRAQGADEKV